MMGKEERCRPEGRRYKNMAITFRRKNIRLPRSSYIGRQWYFLKGLCERPEDWPFSGSLTIDWIRFLTPPEKQWVPHWKR